MPDLGVDRDLEALLDAFEAECARRVVPLAEYEEFLPGPNDARRTGQLVELLRVALERHWTPGSRGMLERSRGAFPELAAAPERLAPLAFEEYRLRTQDGERVERGEYASKYGIDVSKWPVLEPEGAVGGGMAEAPGGALPLDSRWQSFSARSPETARRWRSAAMQQPAVGQMWDDFELVAELGRGAFARVFLAKQRTLADRLVALKLTAGPTAEPAQLARLQHSHIMPIYSLHRGGGLTGVCMPYLGSTTLSDVVRSAWPAALDSIATPRDGQAIVSTVVAREAELPTWRSDAPADTIPFPPRAETRRLAELGASTYADAVTRIVAQVADGLAHAHERGILHRDMKPANILLGQDGEPLILDFNLAAGATPEAEGVALVGGTLPYMAPEQLQAILDGRPTDRRGDIFSLGVVLYELLTGKLPHPVRGGSLEKLVTELREAWERGAPSPRQVIPGLSPALDAIVRKCLAPRPADRYATAEHLAEDLRRHLAHQPLRHAREGWSRERCSKWARRHPRLTSAGTVLVASAAALGVLGAGWYARGERLAQRSAESQFERFEQALPEVRIALGPGVRQAAPEIAAEGLVALERLFAPYEIGSAGDWRQRESFRRLDAARQARLETDVAELRGLAAAARGEDVDSAELSPPSGVLDQAMRLLRQQELSAASTLLEQHLQSDARDAAAWLTLAWCRVRERDFSGAEFAYSMAAALAPDLYVPVYFRGLVRLEQQRFAAARTDFDVTLERRPEFAAAWFHRGLARQGLAEHAAALTDFDRSLELGLRHTRVYFLRAKSHEALGDRVAAQADRQRGLSAEPTDEQSWVARGLARLADDPRGAETDFRAALVHDPQSLPALANLAHVLSERLDQADEALRCLDDWIARHPRDAVAWGSRGVVAARRGRVEAAVSDAREALERSRAPFVLYQAGCIHALVAPSRGESRPEALRLLGLALRDQPGLAPQMRGDPDLKNLSGDAVWQSLLDSALVLARVNALAPSGQAPRSPSVAPAVAAPGAPAPSRTSTSAPGSPATPSESAVPREPSPASSPPTMSRNGLLPASMPLGSAAARLSSAASESSLPVRS